MKSKKFDCVALMRKIRNGLSKRYLENPNVEEKDLAHIREKYNIRMKARTRKGVSA